MDELFIPCKKLIGYKPELIPSYYSKWKGPMPPEMETEYNRILSSKGEPIYEDILIPLNDIIRQEIE